MIFDLWKKLSPLPGGKILFNQGLRRMVPYTGSVYPEVLELSPGFARIRVKDRRAIRNHLKSIHAAALMNMAEAASGLAFISSVPKDARAILVGFSIEYLKKARGTLTAECKTEPLSSNEKAEREIESIVKDESGAVVARAKAKWLVGPSK